ncbi:hypothetical protein KSF_036950 [Reticulibacter mediterranei]|uniref:DZANK-type domain-containing protein n=1 Tax=Reticulibacter mediterranei TaxID=2778369 RepID=A0A8J3N409_9CHLR|nr:zinc ribbon domain-containing protein [Reticulibacter mediterranei]GHO93647.1 hypothetical protein KSF_036950 [Reticulibacter mediterranei]
MDAAWDQAAFEQVLKKKRTEWSRQSAGVAKKALVAKQNLALIPKIQEVMADPKLRAQEARAARLELAAVRRKEFEQFEKQLAFLNARETVMEEEVNKFIVTFQHLLSPREIRNRIQVEIKAPASVENLPALDASIAKRVTSLLQFLRKNTLYDLLQCPPQTATSALCRAAEILYTQLVRLPPTAEVTARIELAGLARDIFQSDEMRRRYDVHVRLEALNRLLAELDVAMERSVDEELHPKQVMLYLEHARRQGWKEQDALAKLKEHARQQKWIITLPAHPGSEQQVVCPNCRHANVVGQRLCSSCRFVLALDCPRCGVLVTSDMPTCGQCGFVIGNRFLVDRLLEELRNVLATGDGERAGELLQQIEQAWQPGTPDSRSLQIKSYHMEVQRLALALHQAKQEVMERLDMLAIREVAVNEQRMVRIDWGPVGSGTVAILRSPKEVLPQEKAVPLTEIEQVGVLLNDQGNYTLDSWRTRELSWYTPVIVVQQMAFTGRSRSYCCLERVGNLQYQQLSSVLRLRWQWPEQCQEVLLSYSTQQEFQHYDAKTTTCTVSREEYDRRGYYDLHKMTSRDCFLLVSATMQLHDQKVLADGVRLAVLLSSQITITYVIKQATLWQKRRVLHIFIDPPGPLPALLLVCKQEGLPLRKSDGDPFQRIEADEQVRGSVQVELSMHPLTKGTFGKLFLEDEALYSEWVVHHPGEQSMRLS